MIFPSSDSLLKNSVDRSTFENLYDGKAPWDIGKPQRTFAAIADRVTGPVLDAGCGTGEHALFFAAHGLRVTGTDFVGEALQRARAKGPDIYRCFVIPTCLVENRYISAIEYRPGNRRVVHHMLVERTTASRWSASGGGGKVDLQAGVVRQR
jgi:SAM-dependent methyltransferase